MPKIILNNAKFFESTQGQSLLDAATRAEIALPYSCRTGRCSSCKSKVLSGETVALFNEEGLSQSEQANGWILSCVRSATTDIELEIEELCALKLPPVKTLPCRIDTIEKVAPDIIQVGLRLPPTSSFVFYPGQYINVIAQGGLRRSYSLANVFTSEANTANNRLELHIRATPDGKMSSYWFDNAKPNDLLRLEGPLGTFFLRNIAGLDLVFLATGTGIAPVKAMLESVNHLLAEERPQSITVYWGGRNPVDFYWTPTESILKLCRFVTVLSRVDPSWSGENGYVQYVFSNDQSDLSHSVVFACGSDKMIHDARELLMMKGLPQNRFYSDAFVCSG